MTTDQDVRDVVNQHSKYLKKINDAINQIRRDQSEINRKLKILFDRLDSIKGSASAPNFLQDIFKGKL